ncbi:uncharacterized protein LOC111329227 [Stylophora pistillata]|uniref:uncharacterized protein LOC111329227 n=1 Tax=Stylophora pistillata TaxID=50429 RepID=UPI000C04364B|nr:uncharacterized protein LOC111329227 [Stylophora pistillata]
MGLTESTSWTSPENRADTLEQDGAGLEISALNEKSKRQKRKQDPGSAKIINEVNATPDVRAQDRNTTEHRFDGAKGHLGSENNNRPKSKNKKMLHAAKMVQQMTNVTTFLSSFKKESEYVFVEIPKHPDDRAADLGFTLHGGIDGPVIPGDLGIFIDKVIPGSLADNKLSPGDRILSINGLNITKVPLTSARQAVGKTRGVVKLYVRKAPRRQQIINQAIRKENEQDVPLFSNEQIEEFEDAFSVYDVRGTGKIKVGAVFPLIRSLGYNPPEAKVWVFMNELDLTANRKLKFEEFVRLMEALINDENEHEQPSLDSIRVFDPEELGYISSKDLKTALKSMPGSAHVRDFELRDILRKADPDRDGKINIQDFQRLLEPSVGLK